MKSEHTCAGFFDMTCEACEELRAERQDDLPGENRFDTYDEPCDWDVVGGL